MAPTNAAFIGIKSDEGPEVKLEAMGKIRV
jgi:hypothetical protein